MNGSEKSSVAQIVADWRADQHIQANRDTQFVGFAALLVQAFDEVVGEVTAWAVENDIDDEPKIAQELATRGLIVVARRAYDLVSHTLYNTGPMMIDCYSHEEQVAAIPDMTTWPEETSK